MITEYAWIDTPPLVADLPDLSHIETEDDTPVDNLLSAKNQRLLVEPLYSSWSPSQEKGLFLADANVGVFHDLNVSPLVPDVFLSVGVHVTGHWWRKEHRSYFYSFFKKPPDVVIEIVSNNRGGEDTHKLWMYAEVLHIPYYVIYDPYEYLGHEMVRVYKNQGGVYESLPSMWMDSIDLGITLWTGEYEGGYGPWLRWCNADQVVIPTGKERADRAEQQARFAERRAMYAEERATRAEQRAESAEQRASLAEQRAEQLAAKLRELGIDT